MAPKLLLASNSPRRRELLRLTGWDFSVRPVDIDESPVAGEPPRDYVLRLARSKAGAAARFLQEDQVVLAADTTVADGGRILGKPQEAEEARMMLEDLRGRDHWVFTAIGVADTGAKRLVTDLCATRVWMRSYSNEEISAYIASGDPFDKAGGYAIQHPGFRPVERIEGCYACVMGLPICHVIHALEQFGMRPPQHIPGACPEHLKMDTPCSVYEQILRGEAGSGPYEGKEK